MTRLSRVLPALLSVARHVGPSALGLLSFAHAARCLTGDELGLFSLVGTASFMLGLADVGLSAAALRAAASSPPDEAMGLARRAFVYTARNTAPLAAALAALLVHVAARLPEQARPGAWAALAVSLLGGAALAVTQPLRSYLHGRGAFAVLAAARIASATCQLALTLAFARPLGLLGASLAVAAASIVEALVSTHAVRNEPRVPVGDDAFAEHARVGRALWLGNLAVIACIRLDVFLLQARFDLRTVAAYSVSSRLVDQVFTTVKQVGASLVPRLGLRSHDRQAAVALGTALVAALASAALTTLAVEGLAAIRLLAGPTIDATTVTSVMPWLAVAAIVASTEEVPNSALTLGEDSRLSARATAIGAAVNIAGSVLGVALALPAVVAASTLVGNLVVASLVLRRAAVSGLLPTRLLVASLGPAAAAAGASLLTSRALRDDVGGLVRLSFAATSATLACAASLAWLARSQASPDQAPRPLGSPLPPT